MDRRVVSRLLLIIVVFMLNVPVAFSGGEKLISDGVPIADVHSEELIEELPHDSIDWSNIIKIVPRLSPPIRGGREGPGERAGVCGPIITHGGKGKNEAIVVHSPNGVPIAAVTKGEAKKDPQAAKDTIKSACSGTTDQYLSDVGKFIGELLSPTRTILDIDKDGKVDIIFYNPDGSCWVKLSSKSSLGKGEIESVVDHLKPIVVVCGGLDARKPTKEAPKKKEVTATPETKTPTTSFDKYPIIKIDLPMIIFEDKETELSWPKFTPMGDLDGDGLPDPLYSLPKKYKYKIGIDYKILGTRYPLPWGINLPKLPRNYTPDKVMIFKMGMSTQRLDKMSGKLVDGLSSGRMIRDEFYWSLAEDYGLHDWEPNMIRKVQEINPNDPLYLKDGKAAPEKKKGGGGLLGKLVKGAASVASKGVGVSIGSGSKSGKVRDQWALISIGFRPRSNPDSAWNVEDGSKKNVIVAVIDSGLDMSHPDAPQYIWRNPGEIPDNGIDDDYNGYVDDIHGWNFVEDNNDLTDKKGHGTFVSGIIAAKTNNGIGIAGINPGAQIMVLKVVDEKGTSNSFNIYRALRYAADKKARVINISLGEKGVSILEQLGVNYAYYRGALIVVAAGNQADIISHYGPPALRRVLPVAAMNIEGTRSVISNKGQNMALIAPGEDIYSLHSKDAEWGGPAADRERLYYKMSGTSFSAPLVTATASLLLAKNPNLTNRRIEDILLDTAEDLREPGWDGYTGAGLLDAYKALIRDPEGILALRPTEVIINKEKTKITSVDLFGIIRGNLDSYVVEVGKGKRPKKWEQVAGPKSRQIEYGFIARIDGKRVSRGKNWVVRITAKDKQGNTKVAHLPLLIETGSAAPYGR